MMVPPIVRRREIDRNLVLFFREHRPSAFRRAVSEFCRYYSVRCPSIEWYEYIDWGKTAGKTFEDGRIHLVHPENWKRGRIYNRERMWIAMVYHEMGHYLFWTDAERKADAFAFRMLRGLRRPERRSRTGASRQASRRRVAVPRRPGIDFGRRTHSTRLISSTSRRRRARAGRRSRRA